MAALQERHPARTPPPLPGGLRQKGEGVTRCEGCGREVVPGQDAQGALVGLTPVEGRVHKCREE